MSLRPALAIGHVSYDNFFVTSIYSYSFDTIDSLRQFRKYKVIPNAGALAPRLIL